MKKKRVLILCTGNSARSQIGEGLLRHIAGGSFDVFSAGTSATFVRPQTVEVMNEIGIDISGHRSKSLDVVPRSAFRLCDYGMRQRERKLPRFPGRRQTNSLEL